jgi:hypothetical protein
LSFGLLDDKNGEWPRDFRIIAKGANMVKLAEKVKASDLPPPPEEGRIDDINEEWYAVEFDSQQKGELKGRWVFYARKDKDN